MNSDFCTARVKEELAEAAHATLDNVRDRALRSAATWQVIGDQLARSERKRFQLAAEKASQAGNIAI